MSRAIRRKNCHLKRWHVGRADDVTPWDLRRSGAPTPHVHLIREAARFHADAGSVCGHGGVPTWFRRRLNKKVDRANKAEVGRCIANACWDDFLAHPHVSNAAWLWW